MNNFIEMMTEELAFSNWEYNVPEDPEKILYDFYFLSLFVDKVNTGNEKLDFALKIAVKKATDELKIHMLKALKWAISGELRHIFFNSKYNDDVENAKLKSETTNFFQVFEQFYKNYGYKKSKKGVTARISGVIKKEPPGERMNAYKAISSAIKETGISNFDFGKAAEDAFKNIEWISGYGGSMWGQIANGYYKLLNAKTTKEKVKWIDHAYDLQHNNSTVFEKVKRYYKDSDNYNWIMNALDWKRDVKDVRGFYNKVSVQLKPIVAYVSKNVFGKEGIDKYKDEEEYGKNSVWKGGVWKGGTWNGGQWEDGTWEKGHWKSGVWEGGLWKTGLWEDGIWEDGLWESGTWEDGFWARGTWKKGTWENGDWITGKILSKKTGDYKTSKVSPNKCKWSYSYRG